MHKSNLKQYRMYQTNTLVGSQCADRRPSSRPGPIFSKMMKKILFFF
jgi:hypothetical protein